MPKPAKKDPPAESGAAFEDALGQLEELVREMESDQIPLEALIRKYEEGTRLYRVCEERLDEARGRIEILRKQRNGEAVLEPFEGGEETSDAPRSRVPTSDGELF